MLPPNIFERLLREAKAALAAANTDEAVSLVRTRYLGRKGEITTALRQVADLPPAERKAVGVAGNAAKKALEAALGARLGKSESGRIESDLTLPGQKIETGHFHPVTLVLNELTDIFKSLGFSVAIGPEIEDDWHNFEALNQSPDHPARDMQDTFYVSGSEDADGNYRLLPRTHTSGVQIRTMENQDPPVRIIAPGRVYRNENEDATHGAVFHQLEGLMVDETTSFSDLKGILLLAAKRLLGEDVELRFRPSFFPYTEPSAEIDMRSPNVRGGQWIEMGGSGMVHPDVLRRVGYDPEKYQGFAFGIGPDRIAMLKYGLQDVRTLFRPDIRILEQFV